jgi:hypothetical protein
VLFLTTDPTSGTQTYFADGSDIVHHSAVVNQYIRFPKTKTIKEIYGRIDKSSPQLLSPLSFFSGGDSPPGLQNVRITGTAHVGEHDAYVLRAEFEPDYIAALARRLLNAPAKAASGECVLTIDRSNNLLMKSSIKLALRIVSKINNKVVDVDLRFEVEERTTELIQNPAINADAFRFIPPKGSSEVFIETSSQMK